MKKVSSLAKEQNVKADSVKAVSRKPVVKTEEFKQEKLAETEKEAPVIEKKEEEKKPVAKKTVEKKAVVKKAAEKKSASVVTEELFVQFSNQEVSTASIVERVKAAYVAEGHAADSIEKVRIYIKPEENMVYYVVNDDYASGISLL